MIVQGDRATQVTEQFPHGGDVTDIGNVGQGVLTGGQETGGHLLQYGIFSPVGRNDTGERSRGGNSELCHPFSIADNMDFWTTPYARSTPFRLFWIETWRPFGQSFDH